MPTPLFDVPPTVARFRAGCPAPLREAFLGIVDGDIETALVQHSAELESALGDHATLPILQWDAACDGAVRFLAARSLMAHHGYQRTQGADNEIAALAERADAFLDRCRPGAQGKRENPRFVDSANNKPLDAPRVLSQQRSDGWVRSGQCGGCR